MSLALYLNYLGELPFFLAVAVLVTLGTGEYHRLSRKGKYYYPRGFSLAASLVYLGSAQAGMPYLLEASPLFLFLPFCLYFILSERFTFGDLAYTTWGNFYLAWTWGFLLLLRQLPGGATYVLVLFIATWLTDTAAYFVGSYLGKTPLLPRVSPNKTLEGSLGGLVAAVAGILLFRGPFQLGPGEAFFTGLLVSLLGQGGDLLESALKRDLRVKDTGDVIPGHGGIMDRFDSIMLAVPVYYFYVLLVLLPGQG